MTFNTDVGKSGILVVKERKGTGNVTAMVKKGEFKEVKEYKYLGSWFDQTGTFKRNILKRQQKLAYMITSTKSMANKWNMGNMATQARMKLIETVLIPSFLYNAEAYPTITNEEARIMVLNGS